jgi:hypothetical protein
MRAGRYSRIYELFIYVRRRKNRGRIRKTALSTDQPAQTWMLLIPRPQKELLLEGRGIILLVLQDYFYY